MNSESSCIEKLASKIFLRLGLDQGCIKCFDPTYINSKLVDLWIFPKDI